MRFGICNEIFDGWDLERAMTFAREVGYEAIEVAPFTLAGSVNEISGARRRDIRAASRRVGIAISAIHWVLVKTEGLHVTHPDPVVRERTGRYFCDLVDFCADLGADRMVVGSPKQRDLLPGVSPGEGADWAMEVFEPSVRRAEERGVVICFEPLAPSETNFINTASEAIAFARRFNSPAMKIILDVKAMCAERLSIPEIIRASAGQFAYFHANDANLKGPGFGDVDFRPIASALREVGYDGVVSVEVFKFEEGPEAIARRSLDYLQRSFA